MAVIVLILVLPTDTLRFTSRSMTLISVHCYTHQYLYCESSFHALLLFDKALFIRKTASPDLPGQVH